MEVFHVLEEAQVQRATRRLKWTGHRRRRLPPQAALEALQPPPLLRRRLRLPLHHRLHQMVNSLLRLQAARRAGIRDLKVWFPLLMAMVLWPLLRHVVGTTILICLKMRK